MPNIKTAKKRVLINAKKNLENRMLRSKMNSAIKKFNNAIDINDVALAEQLLPITMSVIDSTASHGVIHKNNAANKKSAISKKLSDVKSGKIIVSIKKDNKTIAAEKAKLAQDAKNALKVENAKKQAEKAQAKLDAEKAKLEAEKAKKKTPKAEKTAEKPVKAEKAPKATEKTEKTVEKAPKAEKAEAVAKKPAAAKKPAKTEKKEDK